MTRRGPYGELAEPHSNVETLSPVPVKTMRLSGLTDEDRTQFFSTGALVERGKAVNVREQARLEYERGMAAKAADEAARAAATPVAPPPLDASASLASKMGIWSQIRDASLARKASALLLPLLIVLLLFKPVFKQPKPADSPVPAAATVATPTVLPDPPKLAVSPAQPPTLPRGVTLEKAAVDAVAAGDFTRALALYRELGRRDPARRAYQDALSILERRARAQAP